VKIALPLLAAMTAGLMAVTLLVWLSGVSQPPPSASSAPLRDQKKVAQTPSIPEAGVATSAGSGIFPRDDEASVAVTTAGFSATPSFQRVPATLDPLDADRQRPASQTAAGAPIAGRSGPAGEAFPGAAGTGSPSQIVSVQRGTDGSEQIEVAPDVELPAVLGAADGGAAANVTPQAAAAERLGNDFLDAVLPTPGLLPTDKAEWQMTVDEADERYVSLFGVESFKEMKTRLAKEALAGQR
jgi:hypothetical protein